MTKPSTPSKKKSLQPLSNNKVAYGFDRIVLYEFNLLEEHRAFVQEHFTKRISKFEQTFEDEIASVPDLENRAAYEDHLIDEYQKLANDLPRLQWYAQLLVAYSMFENTLNELCRIVERRTGSQLSFKDLSGQGIVRAANYLTKVFDVKSPFQSAPWQKAKLLGEIRNAIAHRNGEIEYELE